MAPDTNVLFITADQWRGDCLGAAAHPVVRTPNLDRLAAGGVVVPPPFRPGRALRAEPGGALHGHVPDEPPVGAERHAARRPPRQRRARGPPPRLRTGAVRLHRHERRPPHRRRPATRACSRYEGVLPGFDPVCHLPEGEPFEWLEWMRADGVDVPDDWRTFVDRPGRRARTWRDAVRRRALADHVPHRPVHRVGRRPAAARRPAAGSRTSRSCARIRRSSRPRPTTRCSIPRRCPRRCAPRRARDEGAQHPLLGVMIDHPFLKSPDDDQEQRELQATYYGMLAEVDDQIGRAPRLARRVGPGRPHARDLHERSRREPRRPLHAAQARVVRPVVPRAADRARSGRRPTAVASSTRSPSTSTCCRRSASCSAPRFRCSATAARSRRGCAGATPDDWRAGDALRVRLPRSRQRADRGGVRAHAGGVRARGAARRARQVRAVLRLSRAAVDLLRHRRRSRRRSATSPPIPRTRPRCSSTRSACWPGACSTPNARSPA